MQFDLSTVICLIIGFFGLSIMIMIHEFGHFISAKLCRIKVESVSLGIGPVIKSFGKNETKFQLRLVPFGGSTKMLGKDDLRMALQYHDTYIRKCEEGSIYSVSPLRRILVYISGPFANYVFAILCFTILSCITSINMVFSTKIQLTSDIEKYKNMPCAAQDAGLKSGSYITSVNNTEVSDWNEIQQYLSSHNSETVTINTNEGSYQVSPINGLFGILPYGETYQKTKKGKNILSSVWLAVQESMDETVSFISSIKSLITGRSKVSETFDGTLSASLALGETIETGFSVNFNTGIRTVLYILGSVSLSLGMVNMLPVTILDGGLILTGLIEIIIRKQLKVKTYVTLQIIGLITMFIFIPVMMHIF